MFREKYQDPITVLVKKKTAMFVENKWTLKSEDNIIVMAYT